MKTANNKIPVSSVFNDSEGLYGTTVCRCLVRRPHYSARLMHFGSSGPSEFSSQTRHRNALTEKAWEDATSTVASEKNRELLHGIVVYRQCVLQTVTSLRVVSIVFRGHDLLKIANINPHQEARFSLSKKLVPRENGGKGA